MDANLELKPAALMVLRVLAKKHPNSEPTKIIEISAETKFCDKTIRSHLKALRALGLISVERATGKSPYVFKVHSNAFLSLEFASEKVRARIAHQLDRSRYLV